VPQAARQRVAAVLKPPSNLEPVGNTGGTTWMRPDRTVAPAFTPAAKPKPASLPGPDAVVSPSRRRLHVGIGLATIMFAVGAAYFLMPGPISEPAQERLAGEPAPTAPAALPSAPEPAPAQPPAALEQPTPATTTPDAAPPLSRPADAPAAPAPVVQPPAPPPATGLVKLDVKPWGEVVVDGRARGLSPPLKTLQLREGPHRIELRNPVGPPLVRDITVTASGAVAINHTFR
jgi:hypothetical protein